ncbi:hypothetical protein THAOC_06546, partial [Thalassiosira oceanica]
TTTSEIFNSLMAGELKQPSLGSRRKVRWATEQGAAEMPYSAASVTKQSCRGRRAHVESGESCILQGYFLSWLIAVGIHLLALHWAARTLPTYFHCQDCKATDPAALPEEHSGDSGRAQQDGMSASACLPLPPREVVGRDESLAAKSQALNKLGNHMIIIEGRSWPSVMQPTFS